MKKLIYTLLFLSCGLYLKSQSIEKQVIGSAGSTSSAGSIEVEFTIGESAVDTLSMGNIVLYQGYHHGDARVSSVDEITAVKASYKLYPNPTVNNITVELNSESKVSNVKIDLYTIEGKLVQTQNANLLANQTKQLNFSMSNLSSGQYLVYISDPTGILSKSISVIKN